MARKRNRNRHNTIVSNSRVPGSRRTPTYLDPQKRSETRKSYELPKNEKYNTVVGRAFLDAVNEQKNPQEQKKEEQ